VARFCAAPLHNQEILDGPSLLRAFCRGARYAKGRCPAGGGDYLTVAKDIANSREEALRETDDAL